MKLDFISADKEESLVVMVEGWVSGRQLILYRGGQKGSVVLEQSSGIVLAPYCFMVINWRKLTYFCLYYAFMFYILQFSAHFSQG